MPQSLSNVLIHLVFSTKNRNLWLREETREELFKYIAGTLRNLGCPLMQIGGVEDHIHVLFELSRTMTLAQVVEKLKTSSSKWMKSSVPEFAWQGGYAALSVDARNAMPVILYVQGQVEHHRKVSFQDELRAILREAGIERDERYLWD